MITFYTVWIWNQPYISNQEFPSFLQEMIGGDDEANESSIIDNSYEV